MNKLDFCKRCKNRKYNLETGIICGLTNEKPAFEDTCPDFNSDELVKEYKGLALKSNTQRAKTLVVLIWILIAAGVVSLISSYLQYNLLQMASGSDGISEEAATSNDLRQQIIGVVYIFIYILFIISLVMWFRRAYFNLHQKVEHLSFKEGWAAGSWFVPFLNLYRPYQIMTELYEETKNYLLNKDESLQINLTKNFIGVWWTLWVINGLFGRIVYRIGNSADTISELIASTTLSMINEGLSIAIGFMTLKVVKDYMNVEDLLFHDK